MTDTNEEKETFESYLQLHSFEITGNVREYLKQLHDKPLFEQHSKYQKIIIEIIKEKDKQIQEITNDKELWKKTVMNWGVDGLVVQLKEKDNQIAELQSEVEKLKNPKNWIVTDGMKRK